MAESGAGGRQGPWLVLCGVAPVLTVTLGRPGLVLAHETAQVTGRAAETLAPLIADVLARPGLAPAALAGLACVRGPGSFTGIRVVLATALGLSVGSGVPMAGLDYLPLLAASAARRATGVVVVVTHARTDLVCLQSFLADDGVLPLGPPEALSVAEAAARVAEAAAVGPLFLTGDGAERHRQLLGAAAPLAVFLGEAGLVPDAEVLLAAASRADYGFAPVSPLYLRPCDAEENLAAFAAVRGLSPSDAADRLRRAVAD
jgi:tRNA threonylcarbamoyladenosine biosynthesis protein TsaB